MQFVAGPCLSNVQLSTSSLMTSQSGDILNTQQSFQFEARTISYLLVVIHQQYLILCFVHPLLRADQLYSTHCCSFLRQLADALIVLLSPVPYYDY